MEKREFICNATNCANYKKDGKCRLKVVMVDAPNGRCTDFEEWD